MRSTPSRRAHLRQYGRSNDAPIFQATRGGQTLTQEIELLPWQPKRTVFVWP